MTLYVYATLELTSCGDCLFEPGIELLHVLLDFVHVQTAVRTGSESLMGIIDHVEHQLESSSWAVTGWLKTSTVISDDVVTVTPQLLLHLVRVENETAVTMWAAAL
jgi:hypothetical protein